LAPPALAPALLELLELLEAPPREVHAEDIFLSAAGGLDTSEAAGSCSPP
jgi:hypothetical protein